MKLKIVIGVLIVATIALVFGLRSQQQKAEEQRRDFEASIQVLSNDLTSAHQKLDEQTKVNHQLESELNVRTLEVTNLSLRLVSMTNALTKLETETAAQATAAAEAAKAELARRDARIAELEGERDALTQRMTELNTSITRLEGQITETERKLATSEGDREMLLKELKRLQAEKAELERQFNDLAVLREQVRKLKEELSIARRLDWIRRGLYGNDLKGGERLQRGFAQPAPARTNVDLNVEIRREGGAQILPNPTNAPGKN